MGTRGPIRRADSIRGERERSKPFTVAVGITPKRPTWLPKASVKTWKRIVEALEDARVPLEQIDAEAIAFYALCIDGARGAAAKGDARLLARFSRDAIAWQNQIGGSPAARARMGIKPQGESLTGIDPLEQAICGGTENVER